MGSFGALRISDCGLRIGDFGIALSLLALFGVVSSADRTRNGHGLTRGRLSYLQRPRGECAHGRDGPDATTGHHSGREVPITMGDQPLVIGRGWRGARR